MLIIQDILVSDDVVEQQFMCNLTACKGACCWEGDYGAPLEQEEMETLDAIYPLIEPYLSEEGKAVIEAEGKYVYYKKAKEFGTPLVKSGACVYMTYDELGIAKCGIESAFYDGKIEFKKPISCHLYPIRVNENNTTAFEALNYDRWDICSAACVHGKKQKIRVYEFAKEALIRKYGDGFYEELDAAAQYISKKK